jgi:hypothetical protein
MKMKPVVEASWNLQNVGKRELDRESSMMGPMIGIGSYFCCAC